MLSSGTALQHQHGIPKGRRVVVTGSAGLCPLGTDWAQVREGLRTGRSGTVRMPEWDGYERLETRVGGPVPDFRAPTTWPRKKTRTLGRVAQLAVAASERALDASGLLGSPLLHSGRVGVAFGSGWGHKPAVNSFVGALAGRSVRGIAASDYLKLMPHTCSANITQFFELCGRQLSTSTACTSGSQAIGLACETVRFGLQDVMIAGGAEELHVQDAAIFDVMRAASTRNDDPGRACRPFDADRDGVVVAEGAGALVVEALDHALERGATILAEIVGFATNSNGSHMTQPDSANMQSVMELALADAGLEASRIGYVNAHGTATEVGDIAESQATLQVFGPDVPVSSLKGHMGHSLGACGAIEAWCTLEMWREGWVAPTLNLERVDERCAKLDYVRGGSRDVDCEYVMTNNFAFGGLNTSLVFRAWSSDRA